MMSVIYLLNNISVCVFGIILSAAFCNIVWTRRKYMAVLGTMAVILLIQGGVVFWENIVGGG